MIYLYLFLEFFKIGLFTFGGGYAMIPLIKETVLNYGWLTEDKFYDFIGVCESTPGPVAINMATFVGASQGGVLGSVIATLGVVLPAFIIMILVTSILKFFIKNRFVQRALNGINAVVLGLILSTGIIMGYNVIGIENPSTINFNIQSIIILPIIVLLFFIYKLLFKKKMPTLVLILCSAAVGLIVCMIIPPVL